MFSPLPRLGLLAALVTLAMPALADPAEDCRNPDLDDALRLGPCTEAIEAAADPVVRGDLLLWRGAIHRRAGSFVEAARDFDASQKLRPDWADPHVERAYLLKDQGDLDAALAAIRQGVETEPGSLYALSELMSLLADAGRWQECLEVAPTALAIDPQDPWTHAYRGRCLTDGGEHEAAIADDLRAIELGLQESFVHSNMAVSLIALGRPQEAVPAAAAAVDLDAGNILAHGNLVRALALGGDAEGAIAAYHAAPIQEAADRRDIANDLAWDLYTTGHAAEALPLAEEAVAAMREAGSPRPAVLDTLGHLLAASGRPDEAVAAFVEVVELDPPRAATYAERLGDLGIVADAAGIEEGLRACAARGADCRLSD